MDDNNTTVRSYKTNVKNYTGYEHEKYKTQLLQVAFTKPSDYYKLQTEVLSNLLETSIDAIYNSVYWALKSGKEPRADGTAGDRIIKRADYADTLNAMSIDWDPRMPDQECDRIAKEIVDGYREDIQKLVVDVILPANVFDKALQKSVKKATADL